MFRLMFSDCIEPLNAQLSGDDLQLNSFSTDTRTLNSGDIYIALQGENFDGHDYIEQAAELGAAGFVVNKPVNTNKPCLQVANTLLALQQLSSLWARGHQVPTIAITGSNGKTTVKELIAAILRQLGPVLATEGNLNNEIGVPLTLLKLRQAHQYAVIEMGANHPGEIKVLSRLASPDVAVITNTEAAHLEGFGSLLEIAKAKSEIFSGLEDDGWAVLYADDVRADILETAASEFRICTFGKSEDADVHAGRGDGFRVEGVGDAFDISFSLLGDHNRVNALAAIAAVQCLDAQSDTIQAGLASVRPVARRLEQKPGAAGSTLIDDSYNANPASVRAGIDVLANIEGKRILILGDMLELGDESVQLHKSVGLYAKRKKIDAVWTVGSLAQHASSASSCGRHFASQEDLLENLLPELDVKTSVLLKGSRGARMDRLVDALLANEPPVLNTRVNDVVPGVVI
ncbi:MAG: UDP-N-acetylmuramoyl-tripeptide--D-alanyl-D-alanine ligase [Granulosicoccaceae bacterium]